MKAAGAAECNGCGTCCDPFVTIVPPVALSDGTAERMYPDEPELIDWMRAHLTPMRRRDGLAATRWARSRGWSDVPAAFDRTTGQVVMFDVALIPAHYYRCDVFDPVTRQCTDYANRPSVCRDYPWGGDRPDPHKELPPWCSYRADAGQAVAPIPVEIMGRRR